jgi:hypothetical protein
MGLNSEPKTQYGQRGCFTFFTVRAWILPYSVWVAGDYRRSMSGGLFDTKQCVSVFLGINALLGSNRDDPFRRFLIDVL